MANEPGRGRDVLGRVTKAGDDTVCGEEYAQVVGSWVDEKGTVYVKLENSIIILFDYRLPKCYS